MLSARFQYGRGLCFRPRRALRALVRWAARVGTGETQETADGEDDGDDGRVVRSGSEIGAGDPPEATSGRAGGLIRRDPVGEQRVPQAEGRQCMPPCRGRLEARWRSHSSCGHPWRGSTGPKGERGRHPLRGVTPWEAPGMARGPQACVLLEGGRVLRPPANVRAGPRRWHILPGVGQLTQADPRGAGTAPTRIAQLRLGVECAPGRLPLRTSSTCSPAPLLFPRARSQRVPVASPALWQPAHHALPYSCLADRRAFSPSCAGRVLFCAVLRGSPRACAPFIVCD